MEGVSTVTTKPQTTGTQPCPTTPSLSLGCHSEHPMSSCLPKLVRTCRSSAELIKPLPSLSNTLSPSTKSSIEPCSFLALQDRKHGRNSSKLTRLRPKKQSSKEDILKIQHVSYSHSCTVFHKLIIILM